MKVDLAVAAVVLVAAAVVLVEDVTTVTGTHNHSMDSSNQPTLRSSSIPSHMPNHSSPVRLPQLRLLLIPTPLLTHMLNMADTRTTWPCGMLPSPHRANKVKAQLKVASNLLQCPRHERDPSSSGDLIRSSLDFD